MERSLSQTLITGVYRSGTEYITQLIGSHPDLSATMYHVNALRFLLGRYDPINVKTNYIDAVDFIIDRVSDRYKIRFDKNIILTELSDIDNVTYSDIYDVLMINLHLNNKSGNWAEKCQLVWREIPYFLENMKNGFAVHIIRDPRSVLASFKNFTNAEVPLYLTAVYNSFDSLKHAYEMDDPRVIVLKYENVLTDPFDEVSKVWHTIGLAEQKQSILDDKNWSDSYGNNWNSNSSFQESEPSSFNKKSAVTGWQDKLSHDEILFVEDICGEYMKRFGYQLNGEIINKNNKILNIIKTNKKLNHIYGKFEKNGEGIQAFPMDPFDSATWDKSK